MASATLRRGTRDTAPLGGRTPALVRLPLGLVAPRRVAILAAVLAVVLHVPFLPAGFAGLFNLDNDFEVGDYEAEEAFLPIELDIAPPEEIDERQEQAADPEPGDPLAAPVVAPPTPAKEPVDAGVPDATPEDTDAGEEDAGVADAGPPSPERLKSPLDVAGTEDLSKHPNVQVLLVTKNMREHPIGRTLGGLFAAIPEWKTFFDGTSIDPVQDFESMTIYGPQFKNSSEVVAVIQYGTEFEKMKVAVDHIVQNTGGEWLTDKPLRHVARAKADRAARLFAFVPQKKLLYILPTSLEDKLANLNAIAPPSTRTRAAIVVGLIDPARPFGKAFPIPKSIRWLGLTINPTDTGGADVLLQLNDSSPEEAALHASEITRDFGGLRKQLRVDLPLIGFGMEDIIDPVEFVADDKVILARTQISRDQLNTLIRAINIWLAVLGAKK